MVAISKVQGNIMPFNEGKLITAFKNLKIYVNDSPPKKKGKHRVWIRVRQDEPKEWRISATLSWTKAIDIRFEK